MDTEALKQFGHVDRGVITFTEGPEYKGLQSFIIQEIMMQCGVYQFVLGQSLGGNDDIAGISLLVDNLTEEQKENLHKFLKTVRGVIDHSITLEEAMSGRISKFDADSITDPNHYYRCEGDVIELGCHPDFPKSVFIILHGDESQQGNVLDMLKGEFSVQDVGPLRRLVPKPDYQGFLMSTQAEFVNENPAVYRIDGVRLADILGTMQVAGSITENDVIGALEKFNQAPEKSRQDGEIER